MGKDTLHCLRSSIYIAKIPNPVHFWERTKSWATLLWQALLKGSGPHLPWHRQKTQPLPWSRQGSLCYPAASLQMVWDLQVCFHHWGLETGIEIQYGNTHFFYFPILKERQKNRAALLHSERPRKQFNVLDGVHFKPCPSSTTVTTTEKILFK